MIGAVFPGQGSQHVGMGEFLLKEFPNTEKIFQEASDTLKFDMKELCLQGPEKKLRLTEYTQPALLTISYATFKATEEMEPLNIEAAAGHSVGEYAALVAAGVMPFLKGVELVNLRGQLMQNAVPVGQGGMLAVMGLDPEEVNKLCHWAMSETQLAPLEPANYNSPGQIVISGNAELIQWVQKNFTPEKINSEKKKVRLIPLKVSAPFHCSMMETAEKEMAVALGNTEFKAPRFAIAQNFTGTLETSPETLKKNLIAQISGAVRWVDCVGSLAKQGVTLVGEFGPGKVLSGLNKKINPDAFTTFSINSSDDLKSFHKESLKVKESAIKKSGVMNEGFGEL